MALPGILVLLVMAYLPMAGVLIAFKNYLPFEGFFGSAWVGFQNFRFLLVNDIRHKQVLPFDVSTCYGLYRSFALSIPEFCVV